MDTLEAPLKEPQSVGQIYTKRLGALALLQVSLQFLSLVAYCFLGLPRTMVQVAEVLTSNFYLQLALCWIPVWIIYTISSLIASLPHFRLDRKFGISQASFVVRLLDLLKAKGLLFIFGCAFLEIVFASHIIAPSFGWVWAAALCAVLSLITDRLLPYLLALFYPVLPLADVALRDRLNRLTNKANVRVGSIFEWHISGRTRQANAMVSGIGKTRRILLTDTLISELSQEEVEAIVAHELGHCALHHIAKRVIFQGMIFCGIFWVINFTVVNGLIWLGDERLGWVNLSIIPGVLVMYVFGNFYGNLFMKALYRGQERTADLYSWKLMGRTSHFISAMRKLQDLNLIVFDKRTQWKHTHPATAERILAAEWYANEHFTADVVTQSADQHSIADTLF
jgi:STE24 endopeptidase